MSKFEYVVAYLAYVTKALAAAASLVASSLLGLADLPAEWKLPLLLVATAGGALAVFKLENGPKPPRPPSDGEIRAFLERPKA